MYRLSSTYSRNLALVCAFLMLVIVIFFPSSASAGTLTQASFTAEDAYRYTSASNTRYDWAFTTATTSNISKVTMSVPSGTGGTNRYAALPGISGNRVSTPDSAANSITGAIDIRVHAKATTWTPSTGSALVHKWGGAGNYSYWFGLSTTGALSFGRSVDGTTTVFRISTATTGFAANSTHWIRATYLNNNGSGNRETKFFTSEDGSSWTQLGTTFTDAGTADIYNGNSILQIGADVFNGNVYRAEVRDGIDGAIANLMEPDDDQDTDASSWVSSSSNNETWTVNRNGTQPADIAVDLTVAAISGLPIGGTANYRMIDGVASYVFSSTSIASGIDCSISLLGFTNTSTAGNYSSTITTYDNTGPPPAAVDSATTALLAFTASSSSTNTSVVVDPTFSFTVGNRATACNGESNFVSGAGSSNSISLGNVSSGSSASGGQAITVTSNASNGFQVLIRGAYNSQNLRSSSHQWADTSGTYASPAALGASEAFGYTFKDDTASSSISDPSAATFIALDSTNRAIASSNVSQDGSGCVAFTAQSDAQTPAGTYTATVIYTAVPSF